MKDIARDLGVSIVTVSKALRNHEDISVRTRKRVLDRVKELNYTPNLAARGLVKGKTYFVGLVVPTLLHPFFAEIAISLSRELLKKGYSLTISTSEDNPELEQREIGRLIGRNLDALIIATSCETAESFSRIEMHGLPIVLIDRSFPDLDANYVGVDDEAVGALATSHLVEMGCKRIAHLRGPYNSAGAGRYKGYLDALSKHKLRSLQGYVSPPGRADVQSKESGAFLMSQLLRLNRPPDGVFCYSDLMAIGAIHTILDAGLRIPEDIAVVGSGNLHFDAELRVPLSSVDQQTKLIGERAAQLTLSLLESKTKPRNRVHIIQPQLVIRASSGRKQRAGKALPAEE